MQEPIRQSAPLSAQQRNRAAAIKTVSLNYYRPLYETTANKHGLLKAVEATVTRIVHDGAAGRCGKFPVSDYPLTLTEFAAKYKADADNIAENINLHAPLTFGIGADADIAKPERSLDLIMRRVLHAVEHDGDY